MKQMFCFIVTLWSLFLVSGCATTSTGVIKNGSISSRQYAEQLPASPDRASEEYKELTGEITLADAVQAALERHPGLAAAWYEVKAREGAARQAGLLPNPAVFGEIDQFGGSGNYFGTGLMETSLGISQGIPLGGKISKSRKLAFVEVELAGLNRITAFLELRKTVQKRFLRVYVLQETLGMEKKNLELVTATHDAVSKRVLSGDISPLDQARAAVELALSKADVEVLERDLEAARYTLASSWGSRTPLFTVVKAEYTEIPEIPADDTLLNALERSPQYLRLEMLVSRERASLELAKSKSWPDIEIGGAYRRFNESDDHAYLLELNLPVPLFDRNQGGIQEAMQTLNKTVKGKEAGLIELSNSAIEAAKRMRAIRAGYVAGRETVLPAANQAFAAVAMAYHAGERNYLELLDSQRTLLKAQRSHIEQLAKYLELRSDLNALIPEGDLLPTGSDSKSK